MDISYITVFSAAIAIVWFNVYIIVASLIQKRDNFLLRFSYIPLLFLTAAGVIRVFGFSATPYTIVITSETILPAVIDFFKMPLLSAGDSSGVVQVYHVFVTAWIIGCVLSLAYIAVRQFVFFKSLKNEPQVTDVRMISIMEEVIRESGKNTKFRMVLPEWNTTVRLAGYFKPTILMMDVPLSDEELKLILKHEWSHFLHKDIWIKLFINILLSVFWWNPFAYLLRHNLDHLLEVRCDLEVVSELDDESRRVYLESLSKISRKMKERKLSAIHASFSGMIGANRATEIRQRCNLILDYKPQKRHRLIPNVLICGIIAASFAMSYLFVFQPIYFAENDPHAAQTFAINQENSFLVDNGNGTYSLYIDGEHVIDVDRNTIDQTSLYLLEIRCGCIAYREHDKHHCNYFH